MMVMTLTLFSVSFASATHNASSKITSHPVIKGDNKIVEGVEKDKMCGKRFFACL